MERTDLAHLIKARVGDRKEELLNFCRDLLRIKSYTFEEEAAVKRVIEEMKKLDYDKAYIDECGNAIGVIGDGPDVILFDGHIDTVQEGDISKWVVDPFGAEIKDGNLYGLGASDMKVPGAVMVYAAAIMKELHLDRKKTIVISFSVMEEDMDGVALDHILTNSGYKPRAVIICEATDLRLCHGHGGRSMFRVTMPGIPTHCSRPEDGVNAVYDMQEIISRVVKLSDDLLAQERENGTIALSKIENSSASLNAVPYSCSIYLDRRTTSHLTPERQFEEMERLVAGTNATWEVLDIHHKTWNGYEAVMHSVLPAFDLEENHELVTAAKKAFLELFNEEVENFRFKGTTNGVSSAGKHKIPTIVFGAGVENMCHEANEYCPLEHLEKACAFYVKLVANL
ncbi:MAG: YgeY family selenium metabolism-linked hydrolase [Enterocloster asparagiformis]|nr:YgeY family selenium metabolism-linked hydrolase [Enterocloster asparagiformis]